jgi:hypothetical protein
MNPRAWLWLMAALAAILIVAALYYGLPIVTG